MCPTVKRFIPNSIALGLSAGGSSVTKYPGFWDPKINFNSRLMDPIISLLNPVYILTSCFLKCHFNNILPPTPRSPKRSLSFRFSMNYLAFTHFSRCCTDLTFALNKHPVYVTYTTYLRKTFHISPSTATENLWSTVHLLRILRNVILYQFSDF